jgi:hypothetical protein
MPKRRTPTIKRRKREPIYLKIESESSYSSQEIISSVGMISSSDNSLTAEKND